MQAYLGSRGFKKRGILGRGKSVPESLQLEDGHGWPPDA